MVFDAGSTHTEMIIYKWQADKFKGTGVVSQVTSCDMKGKTPLASSHAAAHYLPLCHRLGPNACLAAYRWNRR